MPTTNMREWLQERPEIETVFACVCDLNGTMRGKRLPIEKAKTMMDCGCRCRSWAFRRGKNVENIFSSRLQTMLVECKQQELKRFSRYVTDFEYDSYLEAV
jgi:glutamine synthetase